MSEVVGTTEINDGIDSYRYKRWDYHADRFLGGVATLEEVIKDYKEEIECPKANL